MATKLQMMSELAAQTTERLTQSKENWTGFLDSAAWLYKYPFHEQVLIHAQRPDATACAPIELWNNAFKRWVNKGAKGIAIIDDSGQKPTLRYVFDVSDTNTRYNIPFRLWQTKPEYEAQIIEELQNRFGDIGVEDADFSSAVLGIAINAVSDNYDDYKNELLKAAGNSALADMSDDEISSTFMVLLMTSVAHTVFVRLGIDAAAIFRADEYDSISLFNSPDTIAQLGAATSDISEMVLRQIERSVRSMERQERDTLAKSQQVLQNEDRKNERSVEHGTQLQAERGLPDSRYRDGHAADGGNRQIRDDEEGVSQGASEWNVQRSAASEQADRASAGDRQDGAGTGRTDDGADGESRGRDGELESPRPNGVGTADEQHQEPSRGNGDSGDSPQLTTESPLQAESDQLPAFLSEEKIFGLLKNATYTRSHNKDDISAYFAAHNSEDERDAFIKEAFEKMVYTGVLVDGVMCGYLDELTGGRGIVFATGTPISNSMTEMYTMQRYLQYETLRRQGLTHFDAWASTFGETITSIELAPEGTGYRAKTRFARFYNLPELIAMFKQVADIQTADMLNLPVPTVNYHNVAMKPSEHQRDMVASLAERAERVRNGMVEPTVDNMLKITNDGRKLALDQRLVNGMLPDNEESKVNACMDNIYRVWEAGEEKKLTQLVFCDLSTPHNDGTFNVYDDLKAKLMERGIPAEEIAFIHDAKTEVQKAALFTSVRRGLVRVLIGSTAKMGAGTNVQRKLAAEHHLDIPWRPSDIEQREGRMIRQGNTNESVDVFRYVTENTFDAYMWQTIESKQKFISQIMTSKSPVRSCEDIDETALSYAEVKALATGNPYIKEKMDLEIDVSKLKLVKANYQSQKYAMEDRLLKYFPREVKLTEERIAGFKADMSLYERHKTEDFPGMVLNGVNYAEKKDAGAALIETCRAQTSPELKEIGLFRGFALLLSYDTFSKVFKLTLKGTLSHTIDLGSDIHGNIQRMENAFDMFPTRLNACEQALANIQTQIENAKAEAEKPFAQEDELRTKSARLAELDAMLNMDKRENNTLDAAPEQEEERTKRRSEPEYER